MDDIGPPEEPTIPPLNYKRIALVADEVDYLCSYWRINHGSMFEWAAKLLYDLTKLEEAGYVLSVNKGAVDAVSNEFVHDLAYRSRFYLLKRLAPTDIKGVGRISVDLVKQVTKIVASTQSSS